MTNFQIGAQMYSVRNHCQEAGEMLLTMKALKAMGYNTCQLSGQNRAIPAEQLRDMLDESGLTCACTHISFQEMEEDLDKVIRFHKTLGCEYPGIGGLPGEYRASPETPGPTSQIQNCSCMWSVLRSSTTIKAGGASDCRTTASTASQ